MSPNSISRLESKISEVNILASMEEMPFNTPMTSRPASPKTADNHGFEEEKKEKTKDKVEMEKIDELIDEEIAYINSNIKRQMTKRSSFPAEELEKIQEEMI